MLTKVQVGKACESSVMYHRMLQRRHGSEEIGRFMKLFDRSRVRPRCVLDVTDLAGQNCNFIHTCLRALEFILEVRELYL